MYLLIGTLTLCILAPSYAYHSCRDLKLGNPGIVDGEYELYNGLGQTYQAYCEFYGTYGYQFISGTKNVDIVMDKLKPSSAEAVVRHQRSNGKQYDTILKQHSAHASVPLSVQYNKNVNYADPQNKNTWTPYLYLGFLPISVAGGKSQQGYSANGVDQTFSNCDANPNSYLAFFFDDNNGNPTDYHVSCCYTPLMRAWIDAGKPAKNNLRNDYFLKFEMHMGGCGGYVINGYNSFNDISGAALGMRFELNA